MRQRKIHETESKLYRARIRKVIKKVLYDKSKSKKAVMDNFFNRGN